MMALAPRHEPGDGQCLDRPNLGNGVCCVCARETWVVGLGGPEHDVPVLVCGICLRWLLELASAYSGDPRTQ